MDSVIAVTRCTLPARHRIAKLIEAHAYLHLPLNYGVRWNPRSAAHNDQREIYTTLPADGDQIFQGMADCFAGITGNSAYPGFRYPMQAPTIHGSYGRFLGQYYEVLLEHCQTVVNAGGWEPVLGDWGAQLHDLLPGFPEAEALRNPETLARALAGFVHAVSVWHSAEHYAYAQEPVTRVPQRLRVPPPTGRDAPIPRSAWLFPVDIARQELSRRMFYEAHTVRPLLDVRYAFDEPALAGATGALIDALHACDGRVERRYIPLKRIACSLQF
jgi:hypothetical protein